MILCIGTDFRHKNRIFALRMLEQLQRRHQWGGYLVLVGPAVSSGSSTADEAEVIALRPRLADAVLHSQRSARQRKRGCSTAPGSSSTRPCTRGSGSSRSRRQITVSPACGPGARR